MTEMLSFLSMVWTEAGDRTAVSPWAAMLSWMVWLRRTSRGWLIRVDLAVCGSWFAEVEIVAGVGKKGEISNRIAVDSYVARLGHVL